MKDRQLAKADNIEVTTRDDGGPTISGYAAVFYRANDPGTEYEIWEGARERILPGAFDRALGEGDDVRALFNHDSNHVLGRASAGTLRMDTNKRGLRYEVDLPDTQTARDLATSIARGDISGSSFGFKVTGEAWRNEGEGEVREITGVELFDVGPVVFPAYKSASVGVRAEDVAECRSSHENWKAAEKAAQDAQKAIEIENEQALIRARIAGL